MGSKNILALIFCFSACILLFRTIFLLWNTYLADFSIFYQAFFVAFSGDNPYLYKDLFAPYIYPPLFLFLIYPFSFFSFQTAANIWLLISCMLFLISIILLKYLLKASFFQFSIIFLLSVLSFPFKFTLGMGQVNILLLYSIVVFLYYFKKNIFISSLFFNLAFMIKIIPVFFLYPLIFLKEYKTILSSLLIFILGGMISVFLFGVEMNRYYLFTILPSIIAGGIKESYYNQSLLGTLSRLHLEPTALAAQVLIGGITCALLWIKKPSLISSVSFLVTMILLISSFAWQHHLTLLIIPFFYSLSVSRKISQYMVLLAAYILIATNIKSPAIFQNTVFGSFLLSHGTWGMILLYMFVGFSIWKIKTHEK